MILVTGMYNVTPEGKAPIVQPLSNVDPGPAYTQMAVETVLLGFGPGFVSIAIFFFAFTTLMSYYYIAETTRVYLSGKREFPWLKTILKVAMLVMIFIGSVQSASMMWALGDIGFGSMAWLSLLAILLLTKPTLKVLKDYETQKKAGKDPVFDPIKVGISWANFW